MQFLGVYEGTQEELSRNIGLLGMVESLKNKYEEIRLQDGDNVIRIFDNESIYKVYFNNIKKDIIQIYLVEGEDLEEILRHIINKKRMDKNKDMEEIKEILGYYKIQI